MFLDGIGVNPIVDFGQVAADIPSQGFSLLLLKPLELFDEIELKLYRYPGRKFESDVLVGIGPTIAARFGNQTDRIG